VIVIEPNKRMPRVCLNLTIEESLDFLFLLLHYIIFFMDTELFWMIFRMMVSAYFLFEIS
jgi:hypothetical protein